MRAKLLMKEIICTMLALISVRQQAKLLSWIHKIDILDTRLMPSGWNSRETADNILSWLDTGYARDKINIVATGYGRVSVPFADRVVTEITCHGVGSAFIRW